MKWLWLVVTFISLQASATAPDPQSFDMLLTGRTAAGPDENDEIFIRKMIGDFVEQLKVGKYVMRAKPENGGLRVCIEPVADGGYNYIVDFLNRISVRGSVWDVTLVEYCPDEIPRPLKR